MFRHYSLEQNNIAALANPSSASFQQLLDKVLAHQPNLFGFGDSLKNVLESFVSNQNSRIFCALTDLFEWHRSGMGYSILQLTLKHIHSIFRRPPYEVRPYTQELTYAQRLVMIFHICNPAAWQLLVNAYTVLYEFQFLRVWEDKDKFLLTPDSPYTIPSDICNTIHECTLASYALQPLALLPINDQAHNVRAADESSPAALGLKGGKVVKRRALSAANKTKSAQAAIRAAVAKPRSVSFANAACHEHMSSAIIANPVPSMGASLMPDSAANFWFNPTDFSASTSCAPYTPSFMPIATDTAPLLNPQYSGADSEDSAAALFASSQQPIQYQHMPLPELSQEDILSALHMALASTTTSHLQPMSNPAQQPNIARTHMPASTFDNQPATSKTSTSGYSSSVETPFLDRFQQ
ncbi:hypothetical protein GGI04_001745 [Coemansia thaxteri]|nr:hypothetical protein GGI04_001745 [Coemansia thaxteri]